jgi:hypothetical protein
MSSRPEEEEPIEEFEEGEIVSEEEEEIDLTDEDDDFEINEDEDEDNMDLAGLMTSLLATPDGDTICSAPGKSLLPVGNPKQNPN